MVDKCYFDASGVFVGTDPGGNIWYRIRSKGTVLSRFEANRIG